MRVPSFSYLVIIAIGLTASAARAASPTGGSIWFAVVALAQSQAPRMTPEDLEVNRLVIEATKLRPIGKSAEALVKLQQAYAIANKYLDRGSNDAFAFLESQIAIMLNDLGQHDQALDFAKKSMASHERRGYPMHEFQACETRHILALTYQNLGNHAKALDLHRQNLEHHASRSEAEIAKRGARFHFRPLSGTLNALGVLYHDMYQYGEAEKYYRNCLDIRKRFLGNDPELMAVTYNNLAGVLIDAQKFGDAQDYVTLAFKAHEKLPEGHRHFHLVLQNQAILYRWQGRLREAETIYRHLAKDRENKNQILSAADANQLLGVLNMLAKQNQVADGFFKKSLDLYSKSASREHQQNILALNSYGIFLDIVGRTAEALAKLDEARKATRGYVLKTLPALPESQQLAYLQSRYHADFHGPLSFCAREHKRDGVPERMAEWLINGKAINHEATAATSLLARDLDDRVLMQKAKELHESRAQLAKLVLAKPRSELMPAWEKRLADLTKQQEDLASQIRRAGLERVVHQPWVSLAEVRKSLDKDTVVLDLVRVSIHDPHARFKNAKPYGPPKYLGCVYGKEGPVKFIDLGLTEALDADIAEWQTVLAKSQKDLEADRDDAMKKAQASLAKLAKRLEPALKEMRPHKRWLIGADGPLWLMPWAALPLDDKTFAVEKHDIGFVSSVRDVLRPARTIKGKGGVLFADPDFDAKIPAPRINRPEWALQLGLNDLPNEKLNKRFESFRGGQKDAQVLSKRLKQFVQDEVQVFTQDRATKAEFLRTRRPRVLMVVSHGFFLKDQEVGEIGEFGGFNDKQAVKPLVNPMLRGGLAFAGANHRAPGIGPEAGIAMALEITGLDLRGTELVILSACEAGIGGIQLGEGITGLRQAFLLAGADSVVATLWKVSVTDSTTLMDDFWTRLEKNEDRTAALCGAQRDMIQRFRQPGAERGPPHPFYWAGFTLTGQSR